MEKKNKIKTYVLTVSEFFPQTHNKAGLPTGFINSIGNKTKKHTIRGNYPLWKKRIDEVQNGKAVISVRYWSGKPYNSKQIEVYSFGKESGIGVQGLYFDFGRFLEPFVSSEDSENKTQTYLSTHNLAINDGLIYPDFLEWFKKHDLNEPMAIIHFTPERY